MTAKKRIQKGEAQYKKLLLSFFLYALSFLPHAHLLILIAFIPLILQFQKLKSAQQALQMGYVFGVLFYGFIFFWTINTHWVAYLLVVLYKATFIAVFALGVYHYRARFQSWVICLLLPSLWVSIEWMQSLGFLGMPVGLVGYRLANSDHLSQWASFVGVYGLSFIVMLMNMVVVKLFKNPYPRGYIAAVTTIFFVLLFGLYGIADARLQSFKKVEGPKVGLVQANIPTDQKWDASFLNKTVEQHKKLTEAKLPSDLDLILWPETAVPSFLMHPQRQEIFERVSQVAKDKKTSLLIGAQDFEKDTKGKRAYNAAFLISEDGDVQDRYRKMKLFPFMEKSPFEWLTPFLRKHGFASVYSPGTELTKFSFDDYSFSVLICNEIFFQNMTKSISNQRPNFLVNITNDRLALEDMNFYYKRTAEIARIRSVESGLSLVRVANNGISMITDPFGRILQSLSSNQSGTMIGRIQLSGTETFFAKTGHLVLYIFILMAILGFVPTRRA